MYARFKVPSIPSAYGRTALDRPSPASAAPDERVRAALEPAPDAFPGRLRLRCLCSDKVDDPKKFRREALRWHARYCGDLPDVGFEEAQAVLACLAGLSGRRPKPAASALAELVHRHGLERASEVLVRWAR